ncbi:hypothetical protein PM025_17405 [Halorubrum ezzemoulense]|uniref:hypothetical protein n=1 Tax=Halorubrum ezzemoulense TaxID=337243 RepID=UPI00232B027E|nr:hypothetical protein [Halorubrum ezzemoulense]MDB2226426.1 hypothetical protein [Halorubrum ezzemoulense]MDB2265855.1 hypothetical protein [Halorubrum ezzemoulense]MDB2272718.1 hypothetical protein [Halorubrum ezzemoulense]MDB2276041.1 hypothetical protein [Halorubrum ezzemoulense]MDB9302674.1 hypothetical protein [Halorubrum ezzemoulense]
MTDSPSPSVSVSLSEPTNVSTVLDRAGIDYVTVHEQRLLAIYHTGIFNVTTEPESVSNARTLEIECWEAPLPSRSDERSLQELLEDFAAVFDAGDES